MGVKIQDLILRTPLELSDLKGKVFSCSITRGSVEFIILNRD